MTLLGPPAFGRLDPDGQVRRQRIVICTTVYASLFAILVFGLQAIIDVGVVILAGFLAGFIVLQYADVRSAYSADVVGRALSLFNMAMFLGVALMQWASGLVASFAVVHGVDPFDAVFVAIAITLAVAVIAFRVLPSPERLRQG
jgi:hypothetical protein